jgi:hypothetical protein
MIWRCLIRSPTKTLVIQIFLFLFHIVSTQIMGSYLDYSTTARELIALY